MADTERMIVPLLGPYSGQHVKVSAVEAETAIAEGWARDPYQEAAPRELTTEERDAAFVAAEKAARRWRGEAAPDDEPKDESVADEEQAGGEEADDPGAQSRDMTPGARGHYQTREVRGRPPIKRR